MNLLENYLRKVHDIRKCDEAWTKEDWAKNKEWIKVTATFDCHGSEFTTTRPYTKTQWKIIECLGYYMG